MKKKKKKEKFKYSFIFSFFFAMFRYQYSQYDPNTPTHNTHIEMSWYGIDTHRYRPHRISYGCDKYMPLY